jgi:hypothetical protein
MVCLTDRVTYDSRGDAQARTGIWVTATVSAAARRDRCPSTAAAMVPSRPSASTAPSARSTRECHRRLCECGRHRQAALLQVLVLVLVLVVVPLLALVLAPVLVLPPPLRVVG